MAMDKICFTGQTAIDTEEKMSCRCMESAPAVLNVLHKLRIA